MKKALLWAKDFSYVSDKAVRVILAARKTFLYDGECFWAKKGNANFDVAMGAFDGAEVCELIGLYLFYTLVFVKTVCEVHEIGFFRDDGLAVINGNGHNCDKKRKETVKVFKEEGLKISCKTNI